MSDGTSLAVARATADSQIRVFVRGTSGSNANTGANWANAKQSVAGALAIAAVGGSTLILVDYTESFNAAAVITWTPPAGNVAILSVEVVGAAGFNLHAGATENVTTGAGAFTIAGVQGSAMYVYGMYIYGSSVNAITSTINLLNTLSINASLYCEECNLVLVSAHASSTINIGLTGSGSVRGLNISLRKCHFQTTASRIGLAVTFGNCVAELIACNAIFAGPSIPSFFGIGNLGDYAQVTVSDSDWSNHVTSIVNVNNLSRATFLFKNCNLPFTGLLLGGTWVLGTSTITFRNCPINNGSSPTKHFERDNCLVFCGSSDQVYVTDGSGTVFGDTPLCWAAAFFSPSSITEALPATSSAMEIWNDVIGARTATVEIANSTRTLNNREIWLEGSYDYTNVISNHNDEPFTGTGINYTTSTASWTSSFTFKQKLEVSFTATAIGLLQLKIFFVASDVVVYINPTITLT